MNRTVLCPLCGDPLRYEDMDFWKCPTCRCEIWPNVPATWSEPSASKLSADEEGRAIRQMFHESQKLGTRGGGRGSKGGRRKYKKRAPPARPWYQR